MTPKSPHEEQEKEKKALFRQDAIERLSSPEQLDQLVKVVDPKAWVPLVGLGLLILMGGLWGIFGRLPLNVTGQGVLVRPRRVVQLQVPGGGRVLTLEVQPGDPVEVGQVIGTIDQSATEQQLRQEREKLARLQAQTDESTTLDVQQVELQKAVIQQQRAALQANLETTQSLTPVLRDENLQSIRESRRSLEVRLQQTRELLPTLQERVESRRQLLEQQIITGDVLLQAEQEYFNSLAQVADLEAQRRQLDVQEAEAQRQYLQNLNTVREIQAQLQDLASKEAQLNQQQLETGFNRENQIEQVRKTIDQLELQLADQGTITSPYTGRVLELGIVAGQVIEPGKQLASLEIEDEDEELITLAYFPDRDGKQIELGMAAQITPSIVKRERYGGIVGGVESVSQFPLTTQEIATVVGNAELAQNFTRNGPPVQISIQLETDDSTVSGYAWTSSQGPNEAITSGTTTTVQVRVGEIAPIAYIIPLFRSWTGVY
ncbi:NHLP bacteriocin system secretion protein [Oscillatoria sp. CS-180]|uniref:NHLP bacteriocin system secretion protein n=1 Tax=Oscillatoria sp. CS-180 TaxID=3021720 RepID=UPI00232D3D41|nr:NHLP bacteriocin system secretion protein [Oscillatoria sp. CS-180]MDB9524593.1 NHLP bacteriocin system secretion protein [Oscillatoria sp. CS-180]